MSRSAVVFGVAAALLFATNVASVSADMLMVDFNSTDQDGGPHNQSGYQAYDAGHEVGGDFTTKNYSAFGATIAVTPAWPNTTVDTVKQMIDRTADHDASWDNTNNDLDLATDFIGTDTRTANGGNGDWDGTTGTPTYMTLTLGSLPAGAYSWTSYHHDTEYVHGFFRVEISADGGPFSQLADGYMSNGGTAGNPKPDTAPYKGYFDDFSGGTYNAEFTANGNDDVVLRFAPYANTEVHRQIWGMNGFEVAQVPEPSTFALAALGLLSLIGFRRRRRR